MDNRGMPQSEHKGLFDLGEDGIVCGTSRRPRETEAV